MSKKKQKILEYLKTQEDKKVQAKAQQAKAKAQSKSKSKPKSQDKKQEPTTSKKRDREEEPELSDEDLEFLEKYGEASSFLGDLDTSAIKYLTILLYSSLVKFII